MLAGVRRSGLCRNSEGGRPARASLSAANLATHRCGQGREMPLAFGVWADGPCLRTWSMNAARGRRRRVPGAAVAWQSC